MIRYSMALVISEMPIKTTQRYHFTSTRMVLIKRIDKGKCGGDYGAMEASNTFAQSAK